MGGLRELSAVAGIVLFCLSSGSRAAPPAASTFNNGDDGWQVDVGLEVTWSPSDGNPDGFLRTFDNDAYSGGRVKAPAEFLGDWSSLEGVPVVSLDAKVIDPDGFTIVAPPVVEIFGRCGCADARAQHVFPGLPTTAWQTFSVPVDELHWDVTPSGCWGAILANVTKMTIGADFTQGRDTNGLDNIRVAASSTPPARWCDGRPCVPVSATLSGLLSDRNYWLSPPLRSSIENARKLEAAIRAQNGDSNECYQLRVARFVPWHSPILPTSILLRDCYPAESSLQWSGLQGPMDLWCWRNSDDVTWDEREGIYVRMSYRSAPECPGTGAWSLTWDGSDWDYALDLDLPAERAAAWEQYLVLGTAVLGNIASIPYNSPATTALALMQEVGGGTIADVNNIARYMSSTDTLQIYTGRMGSPALNFPIEDGMGYRIAALVDEGSDPPPPYAMRIDGRVTTSIPEGARGIPGRIVRLVNDAGMERVAITRGSGGYSSHTGYGTITASVVTRAGESFAPPELVVYGNQYTIHTDNDFARHEPNDLGVSVYTTYAGHFREPCPAHPLSFCTRMRNASVGEERVKLVLDLPDPPTVHPVGGGAIFGIRAVNCPPSYPPLGQPDAGNVFTWADLVMSGGDECTVCVDAEVDGSASLGERLVAHATVQRYEDGSWVSDPITGAGSDNDSIHAHRITCASDSGDLRVEPAGCTECGSIAPGTTLTYLVRFQNTGGAPATDAVVRAGLSANLDLATIEIVDASHPLSYAEIEDERTLLFRFLDIHLPDDGSDEAGSHGFVSFRARVAAGIAVGTPILGQASVTFDAGPATATNSVLSTVETDGDADGAADPCDNCPAISNPTQDRVVFGQTILASSKTTFSWPAPSDVEFVRGDLAALPSYGTSQAGSALAVTSFTDAVVPEPGLGFYYLVKLPAPCGSWQDGPGEEPLRDQLLP